MQRLRRRQTILKRGKNIEECRIAAERCVADVDPLNRALPINHECPVQGAFRRLCVFPLSENLIGVCDLVSGVGKDGKSEGPESLEPSPRRLRRIGADRDHPRPNFAEQRQVGLVGEQLPVAKIAVRVVEDHNHGPLGEQFLKAPGFSLGIIECEVGRRPAQERVVVGENDFGMSQNFAERFGLGAQHGPEPNIRFYSGCVGGYLRSSRPLAPDRKPSDQANRDSQQGEH
ncbi:MAG TPA: hypothetical protein VHX65_08375 [Pirellulales bacterium]|nr:hypothetical protein [Pirellulales bacterium]